MGEDIPQSTTNETANYELSGLPELVKVRRSDGTIDDGWTVVDHFPATDDRPSYVLVTKNENGQILTKNVLPHKLLEANRPHKHDTDPGSYDYLFDESLPIPGELEVRNYHVERKFMNGREQPLPKVQLHQEEPQRIIVDFPDAKLGTEYELQGKTFTYEIQAEDGRRIGFAIIKEPFKTAADEGNHYRYIGDIKIVEEERGKGYGPATYLEVLKSLPIRYRLRTEGVLSPDALRVWRDLERRGLAVDSNKAGSYTGFETTF